MSSARAGAHNPRKVSMISRRNSACDSTTRWRWLPRPFLDAAEPLLETLKRFALCSQLGLGRGAALLELEQVLCFVPIDLELERRDALLPRLDLGEEHFTLPLELRYARAEEVPFEQREDVTLQPEGEGELAVV